MRKTLFTFLQSFIITLICYYLSLRFSFLKVIFLDGLLGILFSIFLISLISFFKSLDKEEFFHNFLLNFFIALNPALLFINFHLIYPVSLDRSISVYTLSYLRSYYNNKEFDDDDVNNIIKNGFLRGKLASRRRINEQIKVGNFERLDNGKLILTTRGVNFVDSSRVSAKIFNLSRDYLWPIKLKF